MQETKYPKEVAQLNLRNLVKRQRNSLSTGQNVLFEERSEINKLSLYT